MAKSCAESKKNRKFIGESERAAVDKVFDTAIADGKAFDRYGGEEVDAYEKEFADFVGVKHATAVSSGTAAVHAAIAAFRFEPGSEIVCPPITDPGAMTGVLMNLCIPVFADTEDWSFNVSPGGIEAAITERARAIMVAHIAGEPADMDPILEIAARYKLPVIEDCAQAHGAEYKGRPVGCMGDISCFSMMSGKHHTSGGQGGMVLSNDGELCLNAKRFADRGKPFGSEERENLFLGMNYRMTELEAAIGRVQLRRLPEFVAARQRVAGALSEALQGSGVAGLGRTVEGAESSYWFLRVHIDEEYLSCDKDTFFSALTEEGVQGAPTYTNLMYRQRWFKERRTFGASEIPWTLPQVNVSYNYDGCCPNAEKAMASHILCRCHESLEAGYARELGESIKRVEKRFAR
jgi:perosamine synthetase